MIGYVLFCCVSTLLIWSCLPPWWQVRRTFQKKWWEIGATSGRINVYSSCNFEIKGAMKRSRTTNIRLIQEWIDRRKGVFRYETKYYKLEVTEGLLVRMKLMTWDQRWINTNFCYYAKCQEGKFQGFMQFPSCFLYMMEDYGHGYSDGVFNLYEVVDYLSTRFPSVPYIKRVYNTTRGVAAEIVPYRDGLLFTFLSYSDIEERTVKTFITKGLYAKMKQVSKTHVHVVDFK
jgi:hypothetical protein